MTKKTKQWLIIVFLLSLAVRLLFNAYYIGFDADPRLPRFQVSDSGKYHYLALLLCEKHTFGHTAAIPPGYPLFLSIVYGLFGITFSAVRILQSILSAGMNVFIFLIACDAFDKKTAYLASGISIVYPFFIYWSGMFVSETLFIFFYVAAIMLLLHHGIYRKTLTNILGAVCLGIASLVRPVALPFVGFVIIVYAVSMFNNRKKMLLSMALFMCAFTVTLSPWLVRNYLMFNKIIPASTMGGLNLLNGMNTAIMHNPDEVNTITYNKLDVYKEHLAQLPEIERNKEATRVVAGYYRELILYKPRILLKILQKKFLEFWDIVPHNKTRLIKVISAGSYGILMPFFIVGLWKSGTQSKRVFFIWAALLNTFLLGMIFLPTIRYRFPLEPFYVIVASYGIMRMIPKSCFLKESHDRKGFLDGNTK